MVVNHVCSASTPTKTKQRGADDGYNTIIMGRKKEIQKRITVKVKITLLIKVIHSVVRCGFFQKFVVNFDSLYMKPISFWHKEILQKTFSKYSVLASHSVGLNPDIELAMMNTICSILGDNFCLQYGLWFDRLLSQ